MGEIEHGVHHEAHLRRRKGEDVRQHGHKDEYGTHRRRREDEDVRDDERQTDRTARRRVRLRVTSWSICADPLETVRKQGWFRLALGNERMPRLALDRQESERFRI